MAAYDVLVVGRPTWDLVFTGLPRWPVIGQEVFAQNLTVSPGGIYNGVAQLARLGLSVGMIGTVGNDEWSALGVAAMAKDGVSAEHIKVLDRPMPAVSICATVGEDRGFLTYEPSDPELGSVCVTHALNKLRELDAGYIHCCLNTDLAAYAEIARPKGIKTIVDCGWDEPWLTGKEIRTLMKRADMIFMNCLEARTITGQPTVDEALKAIGELAPFVVVKCGGSGSAAVVNGEVTRVPAQKAKVVDATGAGDCFNSGFLYGIIRGASIEQSLMYGNICGACVVTKPGGFAGAPYERELLAIWERIQSGEEVVIEA